MNGMRCPIFIGGLPGSGKTLVRRILGAHPSICMTRKTYLWTRYYGKFGDLSNQDAFERCLSAVVADSRVQRLLPDPRRLHREFLEGPATYTRLFGLIHAHHAEKMGCTRWGDQLGMVERFAGPIFADFPDARMIHMLARPRCESRSAHGSVRTAARLAPDVARWVRSAALAQRNNRRFPHRYRVVQYEDLIANPRTTTRGLCAFLGLEVVTAMEDVISTEECDR